MTHASQVSATGHPVPAGLVARATDRLRLRGEASGSGEDRDEVGVSPDLRGHREKRAHRDNETTARCKKKKLPRTASWTALEVLVGKKTSICAGKGRRSIQKPRSSKAVSAQWKSLIANSSHVTSAPNQHVSCTSCLLSRNKQACLLV